MMGEKWYCKQCGRPLERHYKHQLCKKHWEEKCQYGFCISDTQMSEDDPSEIRIVDGIGRISLYDILFEEIDEEILIDVEDIEKVNSYHWKKKQDCIVGLQLGKPILLPNLILDTENKIEYINGNCLDNRKENLKEIKKRNKKNKITYEVSKRNKNKILVEFIGESQNGVVGTSIVCSYPTKEGEYERVLIECGQLQLNGNLKEEYIINKEVMQRVRDYANFKAVFVSHAHLLDHIGLLPCLVDYTERFIMTLENKRLCQPLLLDASYIISRNCKVLETKRQKIEPFYTDQDVYRMLNKTETYVKDEIYKLNDYVSFRFLSNGHIPGATSIELFFKTPSGNVKKVYYTGDISSPNVNHPFRDKTIVPSNANVVITEATYSDLTRCMSQKEIKKEKEQMVNDIKEELKYGKSILIPCFAQSRTQDILHFLYENFSNDENFNIPIYLDGKLALEINNVYREIFNYDDRKRFEEILTWENLHFINQYEDSINVALRKDEQKIVISSNGMMSVGRVLNHLKANIENKNYTVMIVGYCNPFTTGGLLLNEKVYEVKIEGMTYKKLCKVIRYRSWSSHIQGMDLIKMLKGINTNLIILHHSDESKYEFRDFMEEDFRLSGKSTKIICSDKDNKLFFI